jgi:hypothetical protein
MLVIAALTSLLGTTARAQSVLEVVESAAEVPFARIDWPATANGTLRFAMCAGCEVHAVRLEPDTVYSVNQREVAYVDFAAAVERIQASAAKPVVGLFFDMQTRRLRKVAL